MTPPVNRGPSGDEERPFEFDLGYDSGPGSIDLPAPDMLPPLPPRPQNDAAPAETAPKPAPPQKPSATSPLVPPGGAKGPMAGKGAPARGPQPPPQRPKVKIEDLEMGDSGEQPLASAEAPAYFAPLSGLDDSEPLPELPEREEEELQGAAIAGPSFAGSRRAAADSAGGPDDQINLDNILRVLGIDRKTIVMEGPEARLFCPIHRDQIRRSLVIHTVRRDFVCQFKSCPGRVGGTLVDLVAMALKIDPEIALSRLIATTREIMIPLTGKVGEAQKHIDALEYDQALPLLEEALAMSPKDEVTRCRLASLQLEMGKRDQGVENYLIAAEHYGVRGQLAKTLQIYKILVLVDPNDYNLHEQMAFIAARLGDTQEAANRFKWLIDQFLDKGQHQKALESVNRLLEVMPESVEGILLKADLLAQLGDASRCAETLALEIQNKVKANNLNDALRLADRGAELLPHNALLNILRQEVAAELQGRGTDVERLSQQLRALSEESASPAEDDGFRSWIAELEDDIQRFEKAEKRYHETGEIPIQDRRVMLCRDQLKECDSAKMQMMYDHLREMYQDMKEAWEAGEVSDFEKKVIADFYRSFCVAFKEQNKDNTGDSMLTRF